MNRYCRISAKIKTSEIIVVTKTLCIDLSILDSYIKNLKNMCYPTVSNSLYEKLLKIKKENRLEELQEICNDDNDIIDEAIEISKHQSSINLPNISIFTAIIAIFINFFPDKYARFGFLILWIIVIVLNKTAFEKWTNVYYDLMELKRIRREETKPNIISKLDIIISKVEAINPRIDVLEKNIRNKIEAIEKDFLSIKKK